MEELLRLQNLSRYYGTLLAFQCGDVALPPGVVGLLGPNGAGKSTLIQMLMGLLRPSSGQARVLDLDIVTASLAVRSRVGYVSERDSFVTGLSALEFVTLAAELCGLTKREAARRAHEVLDTLDVDEERYRNIEDHSTGMRQRVKLAQALVHDPELLILDEPTNGLDPGGRRAMLGLIDRLHREHGKSVILSSHLLEDVDRVCDSVLILEQGQVLAHGRIDLLRAHRHNRYRLRLTGEPARFLALLEAAGVEVETRPLRDEAELEVVARVDGTFAGRRFFELVERANAELGEEQREREVVLRQLVPDEEKLDDIFQRVVSSG